MQCCGQTLKDLFETYTTFYRSVNSEFEHKVGLSLSRGIRHIFNLLNKLQSYTQIERRLWSKAAPGPLYRRGTQGWTCSTLPTWRTFLVLSIQEYDSYSCGERIQGGSARFYW